MADVFISYKRSERRVVERLEEELRKAEFAVWFDGRLELGSSDGFDVEIEREVNAAAAVLVCWTPEAVNSVYVRAESKKGLAREVLVPIFVQRCSLPVPFNDIDTADFSDWGGSTNEPRWQRLVARISELKETQRRNRPAFEAASTAAYRAISDKIYPGVLSLLARRIASVGGNRADDCDSQHFNEDIEALLGWLARIFEAETDAIDHLYWLNKSMPGGQAWDEAWEKRVQGDWGAERRHQMDRVISALDKMTKDLNESRRLLNMSNPGWDRDTGGEWLPMVTKPRSKRVP